MTNELQNYEHSGEVAALVGSPTISVATITKLAADPRFDPNKTMMLFDLFERFEKREAEKEFNAAMARITSECPVIEKNGAIIHPPKDGKPERLISRYALFEDVHEALHPLLEREGMGVRFGTSPSPKGMMVTATVSHRLGHSEKESIELAIDTGGAKNATQGGVSTLSYGKRALLIAFFNIRVKGEGGNGQNAEPITHEQLVEIEDMLIESGRDRDKFLEFMGVKKLADISQTAYLPGKNMLSAALENKRKQAAGA